LLIEASDGDAGKNFSRVQMGFIRYENIELPVTDAIYSGRDEGRKAA
jgi:hypothetical protein